MGDDAAARIVQGITWSEFCDSLKKAGEVVLRSGSPNDAFDRAEGFRYLSRLTRVALESYIEFADPAAPELRRPAHETVKIGADNPDNHYQSAAISGAHEYRIRGTRATIYYLGFGTYAGSYGSKARMAQTGYIEGKDLQMQADGSFEIIVSCREHPGNWLRMEPDTSSLIVRQTYRDRKTERIADLHIERLDAATAPAPITPQNVDAGLAAAAKYVNGTAALFADWAEGFARQGINQLHGLDPAIASAAHGDPNIFYYHGYWELADDQALVIDVMPPQCEYWNFQLNNHWMESLDYRYHTIAVNHHGAKYRPDGSVRVVVAHENRGFDNWIETTGHHRGTMCWRWIRAESHPRPSTRVLPVDAVR